MANDDETPINTESTIELVLKKLTAVESKTDDVKLCTQRTCELQLELNARFNTIEARVAVLEQKESRRQFDWLPVAICLVASLVCLACVWRVVQ